MPAKQEIFPVIEGLNELIACDAQNEPLRPPDRLTA
jgi:hypothetical protein